MGVPVKLNVGAAVCLAAEDPEEPLFPNMPQSTGAIVLKPITMLDV